MPPAELTEVEAARLGQLIQRRRTVLLIGSQRALGQKSGVSKPTIQRLESGGVRTPQPNVLARVEIALGWPVGTLIRAARGLVSDNDLNVVAADSTTPRLAVGDYTSDELVVLTRELAQHSIAEQQAAIRAAMDVLRRHRNATEGTPDASGGGPSMGASNQRTAE